VQRHHRTLARWARQAVVGAVIGGFGIVTISAAAAAPVPPPAGDPKAPRAKAGDKAAPKAAALVHLQKGLKLYQDGLYQQAIAEYKKAYALYPSPKLFPNIGSCYKYMGQNLKAIEYYEKFLAATMADSEDARLVTLRRQVRQEIALLVRLVARLRVSVKVPNAVVKVAGLERGHSPLDKQLRFNPGRVNIIVKKKGFYNYDRTVVLKAGQLKVVRVLLLEKIKPTVVIKVKPAAPIYRRWWFWTALGSLVAGGVTAMAVVFGSRTEEKRLSGDLRVNHNSFGVRW
jgi:hypothetical protein